MEPHTQLSNPYSPPTTSDKLRASPYSDLSPAPTVAVRMVRFLCFAGGCILGVHLAVALTDGPVEAIRRTTSDPANAMSFFTIGVAICFAATTGCKILRRRLFSDYAATPMSRFAIGLILVILFAILGELMSVVARPIAATMNSIVADIWRRSTLFLTLLVATVFAVELEGILVRFLTRVQVPDGEP